MEITLSATLANRWLGRVGEIVLVVDAELLQALNLEGLEKALTIALAGHGAELAPIRFQGLANAQEIPRRTSSTSA